LSITNRREKSLQKALHEDISYCRCVLMHGFIWKPSVIAFAVAFIFGKTVIAVPLSK